MNRMFSVVLAATLLAGPLEGQARDSIVAFVGVHVVPMDRDTVLADRTVVVQNGRIIAEGPRLGTVVPSHAREIDGGGAYLVPGLADMHVHLWGPREARWLVANGVTTVRNMFGHAMHLRPRDPEFAANFVGPTVYTTGPIIDGDPPIWEGSTVLVRPEHAAAVVTEQKQAGYDALKVYVRIPAPAYEALMAAAALQRMPVVGHVPQAVGLERVLQLRQRSIEHLSGYGPAVRRRDLPPLAGVPSDNIVAWADVDEARFGEIVRKTVEAGTWNTPTMVVRERARLTAAEAADLRARDEMRRVTPEVLERWVARSTARPALAVILQATRPERLRLVKALHDAGAGLLLGTDSGNPWILHGFAVHDELDFFLQAGLTPYQALQTATAAAASFLGKSEEFGTVTVGRRADLVLVSGNPLKDVRHLRRPLGVMLRGRWYTADELRQMLDGS